MASYYDEVHNSLNSPNGGYPGPRRKFFPPQEEPDYDIPEDYSSYLKDLPPRVPINSGRPPQGHTYKSTRYSPFTEDMKEGRNMSTKYILHGTHEIPRNKQFHKQIDYYVNPKGPQNFHYNQHRLLQHCPGGNSTGQRVGDYSTPKGESGGGTNVTDFPTKDKNGELDNKVDFTTEDKIRELEKRINSLEHPSWYEEAWKLLQNDTKMKGTKDSLAMNKPDMNGNHLACRREGSSSNSILEGSKRNNELALYGWPNRTKLGSTVVEAKPNKGYQQPSIHNIPPNELKLNKNFSSNSIFKKSRNSFTDYKDWLYNSANSSRNSLVDQGYLDAAKKNSLSRAFQRHNPLTHALASSLQKSCSSVNSIRDGFRQLENGGFSPEVLAQERRNYLDGNAAANRPITPFFSYPLQRSETHTAYKNPQEIIRSIQAKRIKDQEKIPVIPALTESQASYQNPFGPRKLPLAYPDKHTSRFVRYGDNRKDPYNQKDQSSREVPQSNQVASNTNPQQRKDDAGINRPQHQHLPQPNHNQQVYMQQMQQVHRGEEPFRRPCHGPQPQNSLTSTSNSSYPRPLTSDEIAVLQYANSTSRVNHVDDDRLQSFLRLQERERDETSPGTNYSYPDDTSPTPYDESGSMTNVEPDPRDFSYASMYRKRASSGTGPSERQLYDPSDTANENSSLDNFKLYQRCSSAQKYNSHSPRNQVGPVRNGNNAVSQRQEYWQRKASNAAAQSLEKNRPASSGPARSKPREWNQNFYFPSDQKINVPRAQGIPQGHTTSSNNVSSSTNMPRRIDRGAIQPNPRQFINQAEKYPPGQSDYPIGEGDKVIKDLSTDEDEEPNKEEVYAEHFANQRRERPPMESPGITRSRRLVGARGEPAAKISKAAFNVASRTDRSVKSKVSIRETRQADRRLTVKHGSTSFLKRRMNCDSTAAPRKVMSARMPPNRPPTNKLRSILKTPTVPRDNMDVSQPPQALRSNACNLPVKIMLFCIKGIMKIPAPSDVIPSVNSFCRPDELITLNKERAVTATSLRRHRFSVNLEGFLDEDIYFFMDQMKKKLVVEGRRPKRDDINARRIVEIIDLPFGLDPDNLRVARDYKGCLHFEEAWMF